MATKVNAGETGYASAYYKQTADIDLQGSGTNQWTPIGQEGKPFTGTYDGAGYTIQNLYKVRATGNSPKNHYYGLFGMIQNSAVITNVTVENVTLMGSLYVGAIVGNGYTGKEISNCTVKGDIKIDAYWYAGVIGGNGYINKVENCTVSGNPGSYIKGNNGSYIGGIWGFRGEGGQTITNCHVSGINISGDDRLGGICGIAHYGNKISDCTVSDCTITANNVPDRAEGTVGLIAGANLGSQASPSIVVNNTVENTKATEIDREITTHTGANNHEGNPLDSSVVGTDVTFDEQGKILSGKFEHVEKGLLAEGSVLEQNPDGSFTVKTEEEANAAVQVGGKYYSTLQEAMDHAQDGETVTLLKDITVDTGANAIRYSGGKSIIVDFAGHTVTGNTSNSVFLIKSSEETDTSVKLTGGTITAGSSAYCAVIAAGVNGHKAKVDLDQMTISNSRQFASGIKAFSDAVISVTDSTVNSSSGAGCVTAAGGEVIIENGTFVQQGYYDWNSSCISASEGGSLIVKSGNFTADGYGAYVFNSGASLVIEKGNFKTNQDVLKADKSTTAIPSEIKVKDGSFEGTFAIADGAVLQISGGTFSAPLKEEYCADGFVPKQNEDGTYGVESDSVVQIGEEKYSTLQEAIEAAKAGETILFLKDMTENVSVPEGKKVVFDLNGKTLTSDKTLTVHGDLTVKDSTAAAEPVVSKDYKTVTYQSGKLLNNASGRTADAVNVTVRGNGTFRQESGSIVSEKNYTVAGYDKSHLVVAGGYQEGPEGGPGVFNNSVLDIEGGVLVGTDNAAAAGNGSAGLTGSTTINLKGGILIGRIKSPGYIACGIYHPQKGVLNMTGGTIYADNGVGILMRAGEANITGGTITATGTGTGYVGDNKNAIGHFGIVYDIKAGYPKYEEGDKAAVGGEVKVTVEDSDGKAVHIYAGENQKKDNVLEVSGGTYNKPVGQEYCADGFVPKDNGNGTFGVEEAKVVQIGDQTYASLEKAAEAAKSGDTLTLLTNTDISTAEKALVIAEGKEITLDLAGQEIKAANTETGRIQILGKLTLKDSKGGGRIYTETEYTGSATGYTLIETIGTFVMESGTIEAVLPDAANKGQFAVSAKDNGVVQIDGGKIEAGWYAVSTNGSNSGTSKIIVNGGELISTSDFAIYGAQSKGGDSGSVEINGGVVYGAAGGVAMKSGTLSVTGGTVTSKGQGSTGEWGDGTGGMKNAAINVDAAYGDVTAEISGGKITAEGDAIVLTTAGENKADITVSGGEFNKPVPEEFCAENYNPVEIKDADGNITYGVADEVKIDFLGGSLRMDYKNSDGTYDFTKTSLRFGYQIKLPEGAALKSWKWDYGTTAENFSMSVKGVNKVPQADGSFVSNLVLMNAPVAKYDVPVYTALSVTYEKDGKTITVTDQTESRSVKAVAEAIVKAPNATEAEKAYAQGLLNAFNKNGWTGYY